jgi:PleD family two-component response regulator
MDKGRVLIVEADVDIAKMLQIYLSSHGYEILIAYESQQALLICRTKLPKVILLDIHLPQLERYLDSLQRHNRTKYIPVIDIVPQDRGSSPIDKFVTLPVDLEELKQRLETAIILSSQKWPTHPLTNLPTGKLIEEQLQDAKKANEARILLFCSLVDIVDSYRINQLIIFLADVMLETLETHGHENDFIGHPSDTEFILITDLHTAPQLRSAISQRFYDQMGTAAKLYFREMNL